jgi:hypothetical protein
MMPTALPLAARTRLSELQLARVSAEDAARSAGNRLSALPRDADHPMRERLADERDRHNHRHARLSQLVSRLQQWIAEQRDGVALELAPPLSVGDDEKLSAAIVAVRTEIASLQQQLATVRRAPLPPAEQRRLVDAYVSELFGRGRPTVAVVGDRLRVSHRGDMVAAEDVLSLMTWVAPEQVQEALEGELRRLPQRADAMTADERERRTAEIERQLLDLERREEALVLRAAGDGLEVLRRPDASPLAVLGVRIAATAATEEDVAVA